MKKFFILTLMCLACLMPCHGAVSLVYINGSNNNDEKMTEWFMNGIKKKLHPHLTRKFEKKHENLEMVFGKNFSVNPEPLIYFWGDRSKIDLEFVEDMIDVSRAASSGGAYIVRHLISTYIHDAVWVQKDHNMLPILFNLNQLVKEEHQKGNQSVLFGYSAGNFITYQYLQNNLPYVNLEKLFTQLDVDTELLSFVKKNKRKNTCILALEMGEIGVLSPTGHLVLNQDKKQLRKNYLNINQITDIACAPKNALKGIVGYANPTVMFYSDLADPNYELNYYNKILIKYILENNIFMLYVNFREDPLAIPMSKNLTHEQVEENAGIEVDANGGFIYDNSTIWSGRPFFRAHTSYWNASRKFSNDVVKNLINGYRFQYDKEFQEKMIKKQNGKLFFRH